MKFAKIDENRIVIDCIVADSIEDCPDGNWEQCNEWIGVGISIDTPEPEPVVIIPADNQPVATGLETL